MLQSIENKKIILGILSVAIVASVLIAVGSGRNSDTKNIEVPIENNGFVDVSQAEPEENNYESQNVYVKYGGLVDVGHPRFEYLNTSKSSFVRGAWYDEENDYMVINLSGTYYHYCSFPQLTWNSFSSASSFGSFYSSSIKGNYDCRIYPVPQY